MSFSKGDKVRRRETGTLAEVAAAEYGRVQLRVNGHLSEWLDEGYLEGEGWMVEGAGQCDPRCAANGCILVR